MPRLRNQRGRFRKRRRMARFKTRGNRSLRRRNVRRRGAASKAIIRQPSGVADRLFVKLKFVQVLGLTSTTGQNIDHVYRGNSLFDPDLTGAGGQPYFYDQWASLYNNYRVLGSKFQIEPTLPPAAAGSFASNVTFIVVPSTISTIFGTTTQTLVSEQPYAKKGILTGETRRKWSSYMSTAKIWGETKTSIMSEDNYQAATGANPTDSWFWHLSMFTSDLATTSNTVPILVTITYYCVFSNRNRPAQS